MEPNGYHHEAGPQGHANGGSRPNPPYRTQPWYGQYMAALFEGDRSRMGERIKQAEFLMLARERELFARQSESAEREAIHHALHALYALRTCLEL